MLVSAAYILKYICFLGWSWTPELKLSSCLSLSCSWDLEACAVIPMVYLKIFLKVECTYLFATLNKKQCFLENMVVISHEFHFSMPFDVWLLSLCLHLDFWPCLVGPLKWWVFFILSLYLHVDHFLFFGNFLLTWLPWRDWILILFLVITSFWILFFLLFFKSYLDVSQSPVLVPFCFFFSIFFCQLILLCCLWVTFSLWYISSYFYWMLDTMIYWVSWFVDFFKQALNIAWYAVICGSAQSIQNFFVNFVRPNITYSVASLDLLVRPAFSCFLFLTV